MALYTFIAFDMPPEIKTAWWEYAQPLKACYERVRWVEPENLHLTLRFLGDTPANRVDEIAAALQEVAAASPPFSVTFSGSGVFPNDVRPRVVWIGVNEDGGALRNLAGAVEACLQRLGFTPEEKRFTPHVTIGYADGTPIPEVMRFLEGNPFAAMMAQCHEVIFMRSEAHPLGPIYTPLRRLRLDGA